MASDRRKALTSLAIRVLIALPFWIGGLYGAFFAAGGFGDLGRLIVSMMLMLLGCIIVASPIAHILAEPFGSLFYPTEEVEAAAVYSAAQAKLHQGDIEGALAEYARVAAEFPEEIRPHLETIRIIVFELEDTERGRNALEQAKGKFEDAASRGELQTAYEDAAARLAAKHDERKKKINVDWMFDEDEGGPL